MNKETKKAIFDLGWSLFSDSESESVKWVLIAKKVIKSINQIEEILKKKYKITIFLAIDDYRQREVDFDCIIVNLYTERVIDLSEICIEKNVFVDFTNNEGVED